VNVARIAWGRGEKRKEKESYEEEGGERGRKHPNVLRVPSFRSSPLPTLERLERGGKRRRKKGRSFKKRKKYEEKRRLYRRSSGHRVFFGPLTRRPAELRGGLRKRKGRRGGDREALGHHYLPRTWKRKREGLFARERKGGKQRKAAIHNCISPIPGVLGIRVRGKRKGRKKRRKGRKKKTVLPSAVLIFT